MPRRQRLDREAAELEARKCKAEKAAEDAAKRLARRRAKEAKREAKSEKEAARKQEALASLMEQEKLIREKSALAAATAKEAARRKRLEAKMEKREKRAEAGLAAELGTDFATLFDGTPRACP